MKKLSEARRRDGAFSWGVFEDVAEPGRYLEYFMVESWLEHLCQHERVTNADRVLQEELNSLLLEGKKPIVTHLVAPN